MNAVTMTCIDCGVTNARRASWAEERPGCARRMLSAAYWGVVIPWAPSSRSRFRRTADSRRLTRYVARGSVVMGQTYQSL